MSVQRATASSSVGQSDEVDESSACIGAEVNGCDVRVSPGSSCDEDVPCCAGCYGSGRQS
jgi:hypothetical protein